MAKTENDTYKIERFNLCMYEYGYASVCNVDFQVTDRSHTNPVVRKMGYVILSKRFSIEYSEQPKKHHKLEFEKD